MSLYPLLAVLLLTLMVGFAAGMTTYQKSRRWCTRCGRTLTCRDCQPAPGPGGAR